MGTDPQQLSRQFLGLITMVLQKIKDPVLVYNHSSPKNLKNQITSFAPQCDRGFRV
jgi:hypothetical protein